MPTPLAILRNRAESALTAYVASSGANPEEVWESLVAGDGTSDSNLSLSETGSRLLESFSDLRAAEIDTIAKLSH
jgi:hypothetical protein